MFATGLLVLTSSPGQLAPQLGALLRSAGRTVSSRLYVQLLPQQLQLAAGGQLPAYSPLLYSELVGRVYVESARACPRLDVRVLLTHLKRQALTAETAAPVDVLLLEKPTGRDEIAGFCQNHLPNQAAGLQTVTLQLQPPLLEEQAGLCSGLDEEPARWASPATEPANALSAGLVCDRVALGGTFDGIHSGHKLLLSAGLLRCRKQLTVGITDGDMTRRKTLPELIAPCLERVQAVSDLVSDLDATVEPRVVPITDPLGPTAEEADLELLVVSQETSSGADVIAAERRRRGLPPMHVYTVPVLADDHRVGDHEEAKLSSSSLRIRQLGALRQPRRGVPRRAAGPYVIGLTGGSASGKTAVGRRLAKLGAHVIDCDQLGHQAYQPATETHAKLVEIFGAEIVAADGSIDRRALGARVFGDAAQLQKLTDVVWPAIAALVENRLKQLSAGEVAILDAAVLLEARWDAALCDEVWVCVLPREEAVRRAVQRDGVSAEQAQRRLDSQMSNEERVERAAVVLSTLWAGEFTQQQVERAWKQLRTDLRLAAAPGAGGDGETVRQG